MSMLFGDFDIEILACNSAKISNPLLEVDSGLSILIVTVGRVLNICLCKEASTTSDSRN